jgi:hypothetical protein
MKDWRDKLDAFLKFNEREVLQDPGKVSTEIAQKLALDQYEAFNQRRLTEEAERPDDFEVVAKRLGPMKKEP